MSIELTTSEYLTLGTNPALKELYDQQQAEQREKSQTDFCRATALGATCIRCSGELQPVLAAQETIEIPSTEVA